MSRTTRGQQASESGHRHTHRLGVVATVACTLWLVGCGATPPIFKVADVGVTAESEQATVVTFILEGENPNDQPLPLRDVSYSLSLDGKHVFSGRRTAEATLPASGLQRVRIPVVVPADQRVAPGTTAPYHLSATVEYVEPGSLAEAFFDSGIRVPSVGFSESGTLEFPATSSAPAKEPAPATEPTK